jgi:hypothetical protein
MPSPSVSSGILKARALTRRAHGWVPRLRGLNPLRLSLRGPISFLGPPTRRFGRRDRSLARPRLTPRAVCRRTIVRERMCQAAAREVVKAIAPPRSLRLRVVREHQVHTSSLHVVESLRGTPSESPRQPAVRPAMRMIVRDIRHDEQLHERTFHKHSRLERAGERPQGGTHTHTVVVRSRTPVRSGLARDSAQDFHRGQPDPQADTPAGLSPEADRKVSNRPPVFSAPPSVEEIAERVLRVIERRARAQRERLGSL